MPFYEQPPKSLDWGHDLAPTSLKLTESKPRNRHVVVVPVDAALQAAG